MADRLSHPDWLHSIARIPSSSSGAPSAQLGAPTYIENDDKGDNSATTSPLAGHTIAQSALPGAAAGRGARRRPARLPGGHIHSSRHCIGRRELKKLFALARAISEQVACGSWLGRPAACAPDSGARQTSATPRPTTSGWPRGSCSYSRSRSCLCLGCAAWRP